MTSIVFCPNCGLENSSDAKECKYCQTEMKFAMENPEPIDGFLNIAFGCGFYVFIVTILNVLIFAGSYRLFDYYSNTSLVVSVLISITVQLIGIGLAIRIYRGKMRRLGIGMFCAIFLFIIGAILSGGCMPPLLFPFPLSIMSGC